MGHGASEPPMQEKLDEMKNPTNNEYVAFKKEMTKCSPQCPSASVPKLEVEMVDADMCYIAIAFRPWLSYCVGHVFLLYWNAEEECAPSHPGEVPRDRFQATREAPSLISRA